MNEHEKLIIETAERSKSNSKRLAFLEQKQEKIYELTSSLKEMVNELKNIKEDQIGISERLSAIEGKSGERLTYIINAIISAIAGGLITYMVSQLF